MKNLLFFLFLLAAGQIFAQSFRQIDQSRLKRMEYPVLTEREGKDIHLPVPPSEHPRVFFRKTDIPIIQSAISHPLMRECRDKVYANAEYHTDGKLRQDTIHNLEIVDAIEARAFFYAYSNDRKKGEEATDMIFNLNNTLIINPAKPDVCRDIGRIIMCTALVYDWCYDLLAAKEKRDLIAIMESLAADMEIKWPYLVQNSVCGHGVEAQLARDMLTCGIAVFDEKPEIYHRVAGRIFAEFIPVQNFTYQSGHHHQGNAYGAGRFQWEFYTTILFARMGYPHITDPRQGQMPYYWIYSRRPDGQGNWCHVAVAEDQ